MRLFEIQLALLLVPLVLLLFLNVFADRRLIQANSAYTIPAGSERTSEQRSFRFQKFTMNPDRTLTLQVPHRHRDAVLRGHAQQHVDVVRQSRWISVEPSTTMNRPGPRTCTAC